MAAPADALQALAEQLRNQHSVISDRVRNPDAEAPAVGLLAAAGPRAKADAAAYALLTEAIREGYLLHYSRPRILAGLDSDLALLAGDYLYALGLERLAALGDLQAVRELSDLISICAQLHAEDRAPRLIGPLWLSSALAVGCGTASDHERAKQAVREADPGAEEKLRSAVSGLARSAGLDRELERAAEAIDFPASRA